MARDASGGAGSAGGESDALVCVLPADCAQQVRERLLRALLSPSAPYHLILVEQHGHKTAQ